MGLGNKFKEVKKAYVEANKLLGDLIKVRRGREGGGGGGAPSAETSASSPLPTFLPVSVSGSFLLLQVGEKLRILTSITSISSISSILSLRSVFLSLSVIPSFSCLHYFPPV